MRDNTAISAFLIEHKDAFGDSRLLRALLADFMPENKALQRVLLIIHDEGISEMAEADTNIITNKLLSILIDDYAISEEQANNAIDIWLRVFGKEKAFVPTYNQNDGDVKERNKNDNQKASASNKVASDRRPNADFSAKDVHKYYIPSAPYSRDSSSFDAKKLKDKAMQLFNLLNENGARATIADLNSNGVSTTFGIQLGAGVRVNSVTKLKKEIELCLGGKVEFEIPLPGTTLLGIHLFSSENNSISFSQGVHSKEYTDSFAKVPVLLGASSTGGFIVDDLDRIGHLLIGGSSGSGKSVLLDTIILGVLYKKAPIDVQLILIDTNVLNLNVYNGIPLLLIPVITESNKAIAAIHWLLAEAKHRSKILAEAIKKDIDDYNEEPGNAAFPHITVVIDEISPIIDYDNSIIEDIQYLAQAGKALGIHLIISTQMVNSRGIKKIKDSISARVVFNVFSESESKQFLGVSGAEKLQGIGDMLYKCPGDPAPKLIKGINTNREDVTAAVEKVKTLNSYFGEASYNNLGDVSKSSKKQSLSNVRRHIVGGGNG